MTYKQILERVRIARRELLCSEEPPSPTAVQAALQLIALEKYLNHDVLEDDTDDRVLEAARKAADILGGTVLTLEGKAESVMDKIARFRNVVEEGERIFRKADSSPEEEIAWLSKAREILLEDE